MDEKTLSPEQVAAASKGVIDKSPSTLGFNFFELTPVNKCVYEFMPLDFDVAVKKINFQFGCTDLSANGSIDVIFSKLSTLRSYQLSEQSDVLVFSVGGGANRFENGAREFKEPKVLYKNETIYIYLISNIPAGANVGVKGRFLLEYERLIK